MNTETKTDINQKDKIMKIAVIIVRSLMGALFVFGSVTFFLKLFPQPEVTGAMKIFRDGLEASVYLFPTVKSIELLCGIAFLTGRLVPLATVLISPIIVNIILVHSFLDTTGLPVAIFLVLSNSFVAYSHRESYKPLFKI